MACFTDDLGPIAMYMAFAPKPVVKQGVSSAFMDGLRSIRNALPGVPAILSERTVIEKTAIVGGSVWITWKLYDVGAFSLIGKVTQSLVPGFRWVRRRIGAVEKVFDPQLHTQKCVLESRRQGSEEAIMTRPRSQCQIGFMRDGQLVIIGCAVRFDLGYLVAPDHVLGGDEIEAKYAAGSQSVVSLAGKERIHIDTDLVAVKLTEAEMSKIGISVCKIAPVPDAGIFAQIVGPESKGTSGVVKHDPVCFGRVVYSGTTLGGYSGAAYTGSGGVLGIHQMGGQVNGGYSASYAWRQLLLVAGERLESSEDWLQGQFKSGHKLQWNTTGDPDYVQVRVGGLYSTVHRVSMAKAFGKDWIDNNVIERRGTTMSYGDYESANFREVASESVSPGDSSSSVGCQESEELGLQDVISAYNKLSKVHRQNFRKSLKLIGKPMNGSDGQVKKASAIQN